MLTAQLRVEYPLAVICRVLHLPRSSVYAHDRPSGAAGPMASAEAAVRTHIEQIATTWPTYGYRRVTAQLRREAESVAGTNSRAGASPHARVGTDWQGAHTPALSYDQ